MKIAIIYAHPNPKSFNAAVCEKVISSLNSIKAEYRLIDLYKENFKTSLDAKDFESLAKGEMPQDVVKYQKDILWADKLIFIFPVWWWSYPAILKGFIDRVFLKGFAYDFDQNGLVKLLKHQKALVFMTTGGPKEGYEKNNAVEILKRPLSEGVLSFCGIDNTDFHIFYAVPYCTEEERKNYLNQVEEAIKKL
ncbi:MAG: NAD(P)H-dependent oxidoreductase [Acidobacteriota bacterium]|nr:NAD(P)H-dependent oxidoreductase [Thermoanaerobaculaceae bacterium]